jgi:hypothetical protein
MTVHVCISSLIRFYSTQSQVGMSFLGIGIGEIIASVLSPYWEKYVFVPRSDFIMSYPDHLCFSEYTIARPSPTGARIPRKLVSSLAWRLLSSLLSVSSGSHSPLCHQCHGSYRSLDAFHTVWESFGLTLRFSHILSSECIQKPCFHRHDVSLTFFILLHSAYRPVAASAMASNSFMRSSFAAGFPLFGRAMYYSPLGIVGSNALLAGLALLMTPLPFIFYRVGHRFRQGSRFSAY